MIVSFWTLLALWLADTVCGLSQRSRYSCPPRCQCYDDPEKGARALHLICKWDQLNTTNLETLLYPDQVRTLTIRCPHHGRKASRPPDRLFEGLRKLDRLEIDRCLIEWLPAGLFAGMSQLYSLVIKNAKMPDIPQGLFDYVPNLRTLDLSGSHLKIEPYALRSLYNLTHLDLSNNSLNFLANTLGSLTKLRVLALDHNKLSNIDFRRLPSELTDLSMRHNLITTVHYIGYGGGANTLYRLDLTGNQIDFVSGTGSINAFPPSLKQLDLSRNRISLIQDGALEKMHSLVLLDLSHNRLTDAKRSSFVGPKQRLRLYLKDNPLKCSCALEWLLRGAAVERTGPASVTVEDLAHVQCTHLVDASIRVNLTVAAYRNELLCRYNKHCDNSTCDCCGEEHASCDCRSECPAGCLCYASSDPTRKNAQNVVQCDGLYPQRLTDIPLSATALQLSGRRSLFIDKLGDSHHNLHSLNVSRTGLADLPEKTMQSLSRLRTLDISNNELLHLPDHMPKHLHHLLAAGNPLRDLSNEDVALLDQLHTVTLGGALSSFQCHCTQPTPLQWWIRRNRKKVADLDDVQCELPNAGRVSILEVLPGRHSLCENLTNSAQDEEGAGREEDSSGLGLGPSQTPTYSSAESQPATQGEEGSETSEKDMAEGDTGVALPSFPSSHAPGLHPSNGISAGGSFAPTEDGSLTGQQSAPSVSADMEEGPSSAEEAEEGRRKHRPVSIMRKTSKPPGQGTRNVNFKDDLHDHNDPVMAAGTANGNRKSSSGSATGGSSRSTAKPRRGRHEPEPHRLVNALIFILFLCVLMLVVAIGFVIYLRFMRTDVEIVRRSSSFEVEPLNNRV